MIFWVSSRSRLNANALFCRFLFNLTPFMTKLRVLVLCFHYFTDISNILKCFLNTLLFFMESMFKRQHLSLSAFLVAWMLNYLCTTSLWWTCRWQIFTNLQGINEQGLGIQFSHTFFMAPLLWWSIQESSYQVFQVNSHSDSLSTPFRCMQEDTCVSMTHVRGRRWVAF